MILVTLLLATAPVPPAPQASDALDQETESEILVTGQRYRDVKFKMSRDGKTGRGRCKITRSSQDKEYDAGVCQQVVVCMGTSKITGEEWLACFEPRMEAFTDNLRAKRSAARAQGN